MPNAQYRAGQKVAYALTGNGKKPGELRANGYQCMMSAGSKGDHKIDIIAWKPGERLAIQCKVDGYLPPRERWALFNSARNLGAIPLLAWWHKEGRAARTIAYARLLSAEPGDMTPWTPDHAMEGL